ncbi:hypothetical protein BR93DRAFT_967461 [Coniochaeta sp. PMI_546]|nr:hypothetical protein BR93DRAFT_967461 [Coniochaeta sp. PMI_546]
MFTAAPPTAPHGRLLRALAPARYGGLVVVGSAAEQMQADLISVELDELGPSREISGTITISSTTRSISDDRLERLESGETTDQLRHRGRQQHRRSSSAHSTTSTTSTASSASTGTSASGTKPHPIVGSARRRADSTSAWREYWT